MTDPSGGPRAARRPVRGKALFTRAAFYAHLWLGVVFTIALIAISVTGVLLNHKRGLGLMPDVAHSSDAPFRSALPLDSLAAVALAAVDSADRSLARVDRMDVRPDDGLIKVRLRDAAITEVTIDLSSGAVLHVGARGDAFLEKVHSGEIFGSRGVLLSDAAAVALVITLITGLWLWIHPRIPKGAPEEGDA